MRPVNLIPPEERRGAGAPTRTGRAPYALIAVMALLLGAAALLATTNGAIADREAEITRLEGEQRDAQARADALRPFATFAATRQAREATIESLARSRFDWQRVLDELSRVIPSDIWLTELTATASPESDVESGGTVSLRAEIAGPALEIVGCGRDHESVAAMIAAMEDIDGVTRVAATNSSKQAASAGGAAGSGADCQTRSSIAAFSLVVGFEEVPEPDTASAAMAPAAAATPAAGATP